MPDQILEYGKNVPPIFDHTFKHRAELRLALRFAIPLGEDCGRNGNIAPQLFGVVAAQEKPIKKCGFALRKLEVLRDFVKRIGLSCHVEKGSLQISASSSRVLAVPVERVIEG